MTFSCGKSNQITKQRTCYVTHILRFLCITRAARITSNTMIRSFQYIRRKTFSIPWMEITIWQAKHFFLPNIVNIADLPSVLTTVESIQVYNDV